MPGPIRLLALAGQARGRMLRNGLAAAGRDRLVLLVAVIGLTVLFVVFEFFFARALLGLIQAREELGPLRTVLMVKLMNMIVLVLIALLAYSDLVFTIQDVFLADDMEIYLSAPLAPGRIFAVRLAGVALSGAWMFLGFGLPLFWAYGAVVGAPWSFYAGLPLALFPVALIPAGLGGTLALVLVYLFSPRRAQRVLLACGFALAVGLVVLARYLRPEQLVDPIGAERMTLYLQTLRLPASPWLPSTWAAEAIQALAEGRPGAAAGQVARLAGGAAAAWALALAAARLLLARTLGGERQGSGRGVGAGLRSGRLRRWGRASRGLDRRVWGKDLRLLLRDPGQWSQFIILGALVAIYAINFKNLPYQLYNYQSMMSYVGLGATGLILAAVAARFAYPAVSLEGGAFWAVASSPLPARRLVAQKFYLNLVPALVLGLALSVLTSVVLEFPAGQTALACAAAAAMAAALTGLGVGLGARRPDFGAGAAQFAVSLGGLAFMLVATAYVGVVLALLAVPEILRFFPQLHRLRDALGGLDRAAAYGLAGVLSVVAGWLPMRSGARALARLDH